MPHRRILPSIAMLLVLATALSACDDSNDAPAATPTATVQSLRFGAPGDCRSNPFCIPGIAIEYGIDLREAYTPTAPGPAMEGALRSGAIDVGVFFSTDPTVGSNGWMTLEDDKGMAGADNVIPILKRDAIDALGADGVALLDAVSAGLTSDELKALVGATTIAGQDLAQTAATWVDNNVTVTPVSAQRPVIVGASAFAESRILVALYASALQKAGVTVTAQQIPGFRDATINELVFGDVDVAPEFAASTLKFVSGYGSLATGDIGEVTARLNDYLAVADLVALEPSPAVSVNTFVVTPETSERLGVTRISDLAAYAPAVDTTLPQGPTDPPENLPGSSKDDLAVGSTGPEVVRLQLSLTSLRYNPGPATGRYGEETRRAVVAFQANNGLRPDGVYGQATREVLEAAVAAALAIANATPTAPPPVPTSTPIPPPPPRPTTEPGGGGNPDAPILYFTFDDGPNTVYTPQILEVLARYNARATFFSLGQYIEAYPDLAGTVTLAGHRLENHTYDHSDLAGLDNAAFDRLVVSTNDAIVGSGTGAPACLRPPYGSTDANTAGFASSLSMSLTLWDVDPQDWRQPGTDVIASHIIEYAYPGAVILMHDAGGDRSQTVAALDIVLAHFAGLGYRFESMC